ncbi:hypothetical protein HKBW3S43_01996, partial [Candidatus Hakubella thermalkaliphila]
VPHQMDQPTLSVHPKPAETFFPAGHAAAVSADVTLYPNFALGRGGREVKILAALFVGGLNVGVYFMRTMANATKAYSQSFGEKLEGLPAKKTGL